ncbi:FkbM family methyltransferase [Methylosinus sporium]|uniref:FkbM family methyltransferase n=2 Tax=Methylocystaceae TaxID=31993 RepID=A0A549T4J7_METSR|nr:FkbM family methyltransferase [Methylosinus sporium]
MKRGAVWRGSLAARRALRRSKSSGHAGAIGPSEWTADGCPSQRNGGAQMLRQVIKLARRSGPARIVLDRLIAERRFRRDRGQLREWTSADERLAGFYADFVAPGDIVFDVGANIGNRAKIFAHLGAEVIAFEPQPYCISVLEAGFAEHENVTIVRDALGAAPGSAEMFISDSSTISSLSTAWIDAVKKSGRFGDKDWDVRTRINIVTMDHARVKYGEPSFVKIDVEGFEVEVLKGLSAPVPALSFEFTPECLEQASECIDRIARLGPYRFNFSQGESLALKYADWVEAEVMRQMLSEADAADWGDVYARSAQPKS